MWFVVVNELQEQSGLERSSYRHRDRDSTQLSTQHAGHVDNIQTTAHGVSIVRVAMVPIHRDRVGEKICATSLF